VAGCREFARAIVEEQGHTNVAFSDCHIWLSVTVEVTNRYAGWIKTSSVVHRAVKSATAVV